MRKPGLSFPVLSILAAVAPCIASAQPVLEFFPKTRIFPLFTADALAHQLSLSRVTDNREWIGDVGGSWPLAEVSVSGADFQGSVGATIFNRLLKTPGHITVSTIDYKVDLPVDIRTPALSVRFGYGHISSHFADAGILILGYHDISSVKDYLLLAASRDVPLLGGNAYAAVYDVYHHLPEPENRWMIQAGGTFGNIPLSAWATLYGAIDVKWKEEVSWGTTQSFQAGVRLFTREGRDLRVCYTLRRGFEDRGQLYFVSTTANLISLVIDV